MDRFNAFLKYIIHFFSSRHSKGYGVHSPFVYAFTKYAIYEKNPFYVFPEIEKYRIILKNDKRKIQVRDFGTGKDSTRKVSDIARKSLLPAKYGQLLFRMAWYLKSETIIELGTSLGITTTYLSKVDSNSNCFTLEGSSKILEISNEILRNFNCSQVQIVRGDIKETLPKMLELIDKVDFVFVDANHTSAAVLSYFDFLLPYLTEKSVIVFDDIYWSKDMEYAWEVIKNNEKVTSTIDLYRFGIVFFKNDLSKIHYKMVF